MGGQSSAHSQDGSQSQYSPHSANGAIPANAEALAELMRRVREDEDAENDAHKRFLSGIDRFCSKLDAVEEATEATGADIAQQFQGVIRRVEERFDDMDNDVARLRKDSGTSKRPWL